MLSDQASLKRKRKLHHLLVKKALLSSQHRKRACIEETTFLLILTRLLKFKFMINQRFSKQFHSNNQRSKVIQSHPTSNQLLLNNMVNHHHLREVQSLWARWINHLQWQLLVDLKDHNLEDNNRAEILVLQSNLSVKCSKWNQDPQSPSKLKRN